MAGMLLLHLMVCLALWLLCPASWQPWIQFAAFAVLTAAALLRSYVRPLARWRFQPLVRSGPVDVIDLVARDQSYVGCVDRGRYATTALEIESGSGVFTLLDPKNPPSYLGLRLPLAVLAEQLDQGGTALEGIDISVEGRRSAPGAIGSMYDALVGPLPLPARLRVLVLLRFDLLDPATGLTGHSTDQTVTAATERARRAVVHHGFPCRVLDAVELAEHHLSCEATPSEGLAVAVRPRATSGNMVNTRRVMDDLWSLPAAAITEVHRVRRIPGSSSQVRISSRVGLYGVNTAAEQIVDQHPRELLRLPTPAVLPIPGEQPPTAHSALYREVAVPDLYLLAPPAHGFGQILGATREGSALALPVAGPHLRSVLLSANSLLCRQVVFRAIAAGYRIAVVSDTPDRWEALRRFEDDSQFRITRPGQPQTGAPVDAVVWDVGDPLSESRIDAFARPGGADVLPPTVIRVIPTGLDTTNRDFEAALAQAPDLVLDGRVHGWFSVEPRGARPLPVSVVAGPGEDMALGRSRLVTQP